MSQTTPKLGLLLEGENTLPVILGSSGSCHRLLLRCPTHARSKESVYDADVIHQKQSESGASDSGNRG